MLEIRDLKKIYKEKKGAHVHALDGVSLKFPEKGMVFLLGKSGSGKSTLLNLCGGLDAPTSGEIIVKGRSSKSFSGGDFDSYRNTFIGFIFQEYNILNEFSVEDNIALALELQGKSKRKKKKEIRELLEQVDLKGYARRKPNTLSGGQKQRIAIARALVKNPEIIMADEPTGALDSNTGKQVFDTLKKLSEDKLVIVVSHDREFAEIYADRIIELKDGKVISDVSKAQLEQREISENISEVDGVLCIKSGAELSDGELEKIKGFLKASKQDVIIAKNENDVKNFKKANRIKNDGSKEVFSSTDEELMITKEYTPDDSRFIRSKLPLRHAIKIGVSGMKRKPFRLFLTVMLCTAAFIMFGVLSTLSFYNNEAIFKETLPNSNISVVSLNKIYSVTETYYQNGEEIATVNGYEGGRFSVSELKALAQEYGTEAFGACGTYGSYNLKQIKSSYWQNSINGIAYLPDGHSLRADEKILAGKYPTDSKEIAISSYAADMLIDIGFYDTNGIEVSPKSYSDIIGRTVRINNFDLKIAGVISSGSIPEKYEQLKNDSADIGDNLYQEYSNLLNDGPHLLVFATEELVKQYTAANLMGYSKNYYCTVAAGIYAPNSDEIDMPDYPIATYAPISENDVLEKCFWLAGGKEALQDNEAILPLSVFAVLMSEHIPEIELPQDEETSVKVSDLLSNINLLINDGEYVYGDNLSEPELIPLTDSQRTEILTRALGIMRELGISPRMGVQLLNDMNEGVRYSEGLNVAGVYVVDSASDLPPIMLTDKTYENAWNKHKEILDFYSVSKTDYVAPEDDIFEKIYIAYDGSSKMTEKLWDIYSSEGFDENSQRLTLSSSFTNTLEIVDVVVDTLSTVFIWIGVILAIFASLLFSNFISTSISNKKREIGILRAVGARGFDVFKIFFAESAVISIICIILSTVGSIAICSFINSQLSAGIGVSLFVFGPLSFIVLLAIACVTALVATFLPVFNAARKKPVDSIKAI